MSIHPMEPSRSQISRAKKLAKSQLRNSVISSQPIETILSQAQIAIHSRVGRSPINLLKRKQEREARRAIEAERLRQDMVISKAVHELNRAIDETLRLFKGVAHTGGKIGQWFYYDAILMDGTSYGTYKRRSSLLLRWTQEELRQLRNAINTYPLAALRMRDSVRRVRERWLSLFDRDLPLEPRPKVNANG